MTTTAAEPTKGAIRKESIALAPIKALIYGVSGAGKTQLALSAALMDELCPVLVLDVERGLIGIRRTDRWKEVVIGSLQDAENALSGNLAAYKTIVLDSLTRLARISTQSFASVRTNGRPNDEIQLQDYGKTLTRISALLDRLQRLPQNVIITAGQKFTYAANSTKQAPVYADILPDLDGGVLTRTQEVADFVWALSSTGEGQFLLTRPRKGQTYRIKSRLQLTEGVDPNGVMPNPTMTKIRHSFDAALAALHE